MLNLIVCAKQVTDPEASPSVYKIDATTNKVKLSGVPPVISPFDENALEAALRIKAIQESKITVLSLGKNLSKPILMKSLAVGADELITIESTEFDELDSYSAAGILVAAIKKVGNFDVILTGIQAADTNAGIVGLGIAEMLDIPCINKVRSLEIRDRRARMEAITADGFQVIESELPCLVTVGNELGELRIATLQQIMAARKKAVTIWKAAEIGVELSIKKINLSKLYIPEKLNKCEFIPGETAEEKGINLAVKLHEIGLLS